MLVEDPLAATASHAVIASGERGVPTAGREFTSSRSPDNGCESVTQFVGHIPAGRAPDHFHLYDEVGYVLDGEGAFHVDDESAPLAPARASTCRRGSSTASRTSAPARCKCSASSGPAGSPAEAYYPDGSAGRRPGGLLMPHIERTARVGWDGQPRPRRRHARRRERLVRAAPLFPALAHRRSRRQDEPEELLAAAHGGCITMSLAGELTAVGHAAGRST